MVLKFTIKAEGLEKRLQRMKHLNVEAMMFGAAQIIKKHIIGEVDRQHHEGTTKIRSGGYRSSVIGRSSGRTAIVSSGVKYSVYLEKGTSPFIIVPRHKKALSFSVGGRRIAVKRVHHPGIAARHIFRNGLRNSIDDVVSYIASTLVEARV